MTPIRATRRGATLIELLVVMSIAAALGAMALMLLPSVANSDYTLKGAAELQSTCKIAQGMAGAARLPRGVRLLVPPGGTVAQEMQYLEAPPVMVADPQVLVGGTSGPRVQFQYELYSGSEAPLPLPDSQWPPSRGNPPAGTIKQRHCYIYGLNPDQAAQVTDGATLVLPNLGSWTRIKSPLGVSASANNPPGALANYEVILDVYPDAALGAGTTYLAYHFGIYGVPVPLLAEPTILLPKSIGIDLAVSYPAGQVGKNYDILFAPSGQTVTTYGTLTTTGLTANTGVFLWVRDVTKVTNPNNAAKPNSMYYTTLPPPAPPTDIATPAEYASAFRRGGEQQIVGIRNGLIGSAPVLWPDAAGNFLPVGQTPFSLARNKLN